MSESFSSLLEYVEYEIWARGTGSWKFPSLKGFAKEATENGLCPDEKSAKKQILNIFENSAFSARRVLERYFKESLHNSSKSTETLAKEFFENFGGGISYDTAIEEINDIRGLREINGNGKFHPMLLKLLPLEEQKTIAVKSHLNMSKYSNVQEFKSEQTLQVLKILKQLDSKRSNETKQLRKRLKQINPLSYDPLSNIRTASIDLEQLAQLTFVIERNFHGTDISETKSPKIWKILHHQKQDTFLPFQKLPKKLAWFSTNEIGAAYAITNGSPFTGFGGEILFSGSPRPGFPVSLVFLVSLHEKHCFMFEDTNENTEIPRIADSSASFDFGVEFIDSHSLVRVTEKNAAVPVFLVIHSNSNE